MPEPPLQRKKSNSDLLCRKYSTRTVRTWKMVSKRHNRQVGNENMLFVLMCGGVKVKVSKHNQGHLHASPQESKEPQDFPFPDWKSRWNII